MTAPAADPQATAERRGADGRPWPSFAEALAVWARVALLSFGGPAGQIAVMHRILVEEKRWLGEARFLHALNFCMLLPGPEAQQLTIYIGWLMHRVRGGVAAGLLFVLPGAVAVLALSWVYALYGNVGVVAGLFLGLKAAVLAIVLQAVTRIARRALRNGAMIALAAASFVLIFFFAAPFPLLIAAAALLGYVGGRLELPAFRGGGADAAGVAPAADAATILGAGAASRPAAGAALPALAAALLWLTPVGALLLLLGPDHVFSDIALFFSQMAIVTFGGAYAVLAYVAQTAVDGYGWLRPGEMLDGLGMAETTPGPLIMVTQFVGFMAAFRDPGALSPLAAATLGGLLATWVTFAPCFLWIFLGAPFIERLRGHRALAAALATITAAVVGVILNLAVWFALHVLFREVGTFDAAGLRVVYPTPASLHPAAAALTAAALVATFGFRLGPFALLTAAALLGITLNAAGLA